MLSVRIMNFAESFIRDLAANWNSMAYSMVHPLYSSWEVIFQRLPQDFASFNETKWPLNEIEWLGMSKLSEVRDISSTISSDPSDLNMGGIGSGAAPSGAGYGGAGGYASGGAGTGGYGDAPVGCRSAWGSGGAAYGSGGSSPGYGGTAGDSVSGYGGSGAWGSGGGGAGLATGTRVMVMAEVRADMDPIPRVMEGEEAGMVAALPGMEIQVVEEPAVGATLGAMETFMGALAMLIRHGGQEEQTHTALLQLDLAVLKLNIFSKTLQNRIQTERSRTTTLRV
ncbi:hypothetical protein MPTK1_6g19090 [Marchantia polymorpha subsp. ruderalis]|nr:hypothetical protein MARPO_0045s0154 [Marchantia polymorpha]BBN15375.1 hypothetical protein Mp_6g19090 [Marchantia polymorpha subsp. ruderalis]|eukprot:PTQ39514.1 hypothetical protein MARPO_0045s0154 [Marchantia polymorpha]